MLDARRIREDAAEEAAKLMQTLYTERDHVLADARDDVRRIVDGAYETMWTDDEPFPLTEGEPPTAETSESGAEDIPDADSPAPSGDDVWLVEGDELTIETTSSPRVSRGTWKRRRHRWFHRSS